MKQHWPLAVIVVAYCVVGSLFAIRVPAWQTPDEPAHYNYARQLVQTGSVPVIEPSDWGVKLVPIGPDQRDVPVERLTYEDHQPPLFYALAAPVYGLANGQLVPMRLFSLLLGALTIVFTYFTVATIFPQHLYLAAFAAAFVALLPQHVFMMSGFNNDSLAEAMLALAVWLSVRLIQDGVRDGERATNRQMLILAIVVGLCFWVKATAYLALPVAAFALWRANRSLRAALPGLVLLGVVVGAVGLPWWIHNLQMYGGLDFLGLTRHNEVVVGQPTTASAIAQTGFAGLMAALLRTTFQSFWGQFGWMSIPLDSRLYLMLLAFTLASAVAFLAWWLHGRSAKRRLQGQTHTKSGASIYSPFLVLTETQSRQLTLLAVLALLTLLAFIWYNLQFVQHQGRYLYPALIPIGTALALGWCFLFSRREAIARWLWLAVLMGLAAFDLYLLFRVVLPQMGA
jgi:4-amino-4-deoxy-L-arabinose transferase-like glycosyltransferase